jgi:uncharacterized protein YciI
MTFLVLGYDGVDENAQARRMAARPAHIALGDKLRDEGKLKYAVALLNEKDQMTGSMLVCEYESRTALEEWLKTEPYVTGKVWEKIEVKPCRIGPSFAGK